MQKKRDIVGAVEQISSKDIADRIGSYQNVSRSLQGAIPGLTVTFSDGKPTRGASFQVRGANSIGAGGSALILVDQFGRHGALVEVVRTVVGDLHLAFFGAFGGDEDDAERTARTVDGRR